MTRKAFSAAFVLTLLLHSPAVFAQGVAVRDDRGRVFTGGAGAARIISLAPNVTEILFAIGAGPRVAGVTRYCDYPPETAFLPKIGGFLDPDVERIRALSPDLVIAFRGNSLEILDRLERLGLHVFVLDIGHRLADIPRLVSQVGAAVGRDEAAADLVRDMEAMERRVSAALDRISDRPRVFLKLQGEGLWTCGRDSYFTDLVERAGGRSVTDGLPKSWLEYGAESLVRDDPDLIVVLARSDGDFARSVEWFKRQPGLRELSAVKAGRILRLDENSASRFGPRLFDSLEETARLLHPGAFRD